MESLLSFIGQCETEARQMAVKGMSHLFTILLTIAIAAPFFGKSIIGITLGVTVLMSFGVIGWKWRAIFQKDKMKIFLTSREFLSIAALCACWGVSSFLALDSDLALKNWAEMVGLMIGGLVIFTALTQVGLDIRRLAVYTVLLASVCAGLMVSAPWIVGLVDIEWSSSYGSVLAMLVPIAAMIAYADNGNKTILWWLCIFIMTAGIFASGGRTAWIVLGVIMVIFPFLFPWKGIGRPVIKSLCAVVLMGSGAFLGLTSYQLNVGEDIAFARAQAMTNMERPASGRLTVWENSLPHIIDNLWLGVGIKGTKALEIEKAEGMPVLHMHNAILEFLLETGVVGLVAFIVVIAVFVFSFLKTYRTSDNLTARRGGMAVFMVCIAYGVASMALTSMFHAWWFLYMVVLLILMKKTEQGLSLSVIASEQRERGNP